MTPPIRPEPSPAQMPRSWGPDRSPFYKRYLQQQGLNILASGGSDDDVLKFYELEKTTPLSRLPKAPAKETWRRTQSFEENVGDAIIQGVTYGFGDEAIAGLLAATTGLTYDEAVSEYRANLAQFRRERPGVALGAEVAGGVMSAVLGARAVNAATPAAFTRSALDVGGTTVGQRIAAAITQGAASGAVAGAGNAEGGLGPRTLGALFGLATGGVVGGTLAGLGGATGTLGKAVVRAGTRGFERIQARLGVSPERVAREEIYRALRNDGLIDADGLLNQAALDQRLADLAAQGFNPTTLEVGGEAVLDLAAQASKSLSPEVQQVIELFQQRQLGQDQRLVGALWGELTRNTKLGINNAVDAIKQFNELALRLSKPWYEKAHAQLMPVTREMRKLFDDEPVLYDIYNAGALAAEREAALGIGHGLKVAQLSRGTDPALLKQIQAFGGGPAVQAQLRSQIAHTFPAELPIRGIDYMQRGLRDIQQQAAKSGKSLSKSQVRTLQRMIDVVQDEADAASPAFRNARSLFNTHKGFAESIQKGIDAFRKQPSAIRRELLSLKPRDRDAYRLGWVEALRESRGSNPDATAELFGVTLFGGGGAVRSRRAMQIRAIFADAPDAADAFMERVAGEARVSYTTPRLGSGSFPAPQEAEQAIEGTLPNVRATLGVATAAAAQRGAARAQRNFQELVNHEVIRLLGAGLRGGPDEVRALFATLRDTESRALRKAQLGSKTAIGAGHATGTTVGSFMR